MSRNLNKVMLIGNAGRDPDLYETASGKKVAHLSLATSRRTGRGEEAEQRTDWHRLTFWDGLADIATDYIRKGDRLYVEGRLEYDSFEKNGVTIPTVEILVSELILLGGSPPPALAGAGARTGISFPGGEEDDDLPF